VLGLAQNKRSLAPWGGINHNNVRDYIKEYVWVLGVIGLAKATFAGYGAKAKTSILFLRRKDEPDEGEQQEVFMAIAENTGYAPNGAQVAGNELPDLLLEWRHFRRGGPLGGPRAWISTVGDRLDPKFYRARSATPTADVEAVGGDFHQRATAITDSYENFADEVSAAFRETTFEQKRLGELVEEVQTRESVQPETDYRLVGVRWWGGGTFVREEKKGNDIKAKSLCRIAPGYLIYNRLFAFRGSFAVVPEEHAGTYVSTEFPTFVAKRDVKPPELVTQYIAYLLSSPQYLEIIEAQSTGSTKESRNRWNQSLFEAFEIQIPSDPPGLERMVAVLAKAAALRREQEELLDRSKALREGVALMLPMPGDARGAEA